MYHPIRVSCLNLQEIYEVARKTQKEKTPKKTKTDLLSNQGPNIGPW